MIRFKTAVAAVAAAVALVAAGGCSNSSSGSGDAGQVTLEAYDYYVATSPQGKAIDALYGQYQQAHPGVKIQRTVVPQNLLPKLQSMATTNSLPDIAMVDNPDYPV